MASAGGGSGTAAEGPPEATRYDFFPQDRLVTPFGPVDLQQRLGLLLAPPSAGDGGDVSMAPETKLAEPTAVCPLATTTGVDDAFSVYAFFLDQSVLVPGAIGWGQLSPSEFYRSSRCLLYLFLFQTLRRGELRVAEKRAGLTTITHLPGAGWLFLNYERAVPLIPVRVAGGGEKRKTYTDDNDQENTAPGRRKRRRRGDGEDGDEDDGDEEEQLSLAQKKKASLAEEARQTLNAVTQFALHKAHGDVNVQRYSLAHWLQRFLTVTNPSKLLEFKPASSPCRFIHEALREWQPLMELRKRDDLLRALASVTLENLDTFVKNFELWNPAALGHPLHPSKVFGFAATLKRIRKLYPHLKCARNEHWIYADRENSLPVFLPTHFQTWVLRPDTAIPKRFFATFLPTFKPPADWASDDFKLALHKLQGTHTEDEVKQLYRQLCGAPTQSKDRRLTLQSYKEHWRGVMGGLRDKDKRRRASLEACRNFEALMQPTSALSTYLLKTVELTQKLRRTNGNLCLMRGAFADPDCAIDYGGQLMLSLLMDIDQYCAISYIHVILMLGILTAMTSCYDVPGTSITTFTVIFEGASAAGKSLIIKLLQEFLPLETYAYETEKANLGGDYEGRLQGCEEAPEASLGIDSRRLVNKHERHEIIKGRAGASASATTAETLAKNGATSRALGVAQMRVGDDGRRIVQRSTTITFGCRYLCTNQDTLTMSVASVNRTMPYRVPGVMDGVQQGRDPVTLHATADVSTAPLKPMERKLAEWMRRTHCVAVYLDCLASAKVLADIETRGSKFRLLCVMELLRKTGMIGRLMSVRDIDKADRIVRGYTLMRAISAVYDLGINGPDRGESDKPEHLRLIEPLLVATDSATLFALEMATPLFYDEIYFDIAPLLWALMFGVEVPVLDFAHPKYNGGTLRYITAHIFPAGSSEMKKIWWLSTQLSTHLQRKWEGRTIENAVCNLCNRFIVDGSRTVPVLRFLSSAEEESKNMYINVHVRFFTIYGRGPQSTNMLFDAFRCVLQPGTPVQPQVVRCRRPPGRLSEFIVEEVGPLSATNWCTSLWEQEFKHTSWGKVYCELRTRCAAHTAHTPASVREINQKALREHCAALPIDGTVTTFPVGFDRLVRDASRLHVMGNATPWAIANPSRCSPEEWERLQQLTGAPPSRYRPADQSTAEIVMAEDLDTEMVRRHLEETLGLAPNPKHFAYPRNLQRLVNAYGALHKQGRGLAEAVRDAEAIVDAAPDLAEEQDAKLGDQKQSFVAQLLALWMLYAEHAALPNAATMTVDHVAHFIARWDVGWSKADALYILQQWQVAWGDSELGRAHAQLAPMDVGAEDLVEGAAGYDDGDDDAKDGAGSVIDMDAYASEPEPTTAAMATPLPKRAVSAATASVTRSRAPLSQEDDSRDGGGGGGSSAVAMDIDSQLAELESDTRVAHASSPVATAAAAASPVLSLFDKVTAPVTDALALAP